MPWCGIQIDYRMCAEPNALPCQTTASTLFQRTIKHASQEGYQTKSPSAGVQKLMTWPESLLLYPNSNVIYGMAEWLSEWLCNKFLLGAAPWNIIGENWNVSQHGCGGGVDIFDILKGDAGLSLFLDQPDQYLLSEALLHTRQGTNRAPLVSTYIYVHA